MDLATYSLLEEGANTLFPQYTNNPGIDYLMKWIPKSEELLRQMLTTSGQVSNTSQVPVQGQYVGTDTRRIGGNNRNIDLANTGSISDKYDMTVVGPNEEVITRGGKKIIVPKDRPRGGGRIIPGTRDWWDWVTGQPDQDHDKQSGRPLPELTRRQQSLSDKETQIKVEQLGLGHEERKQQIELRKQQRIAEITTNAQVRTAEKLYPLMRAAGWDQLGRALYGDNYSATKAQRRVLMSQTGEASMINAIANQASAGIVPRPTYRGKNIAFG